MLERDEAYRQIQNLLAEREALRLQLESLKSHVRLLSDQFCRLAQTNRFAPPPPRLPDISHFPVGPCFVGSPVPPMFGGIAFENTSGDI